MRRKTPYWEYLVVGGGQLLTGLLVLGVGVYYDWLQRMPGILTLAGLGLLAGPGFFVAFRRASKIIDDRGPSSKRALKALELEDDE